FADDGLVRSANSKVEAIFGHVPSELVGRNVSTLIPVLGVLEAAPTKEGRQSLEGAIARLGRETEGRHRDGGHLFLEVAISRYRIHGQPRWTAILRDIGQRVRNMADLKQARHDAEEASRAKSAFVATMSHEIRTPMNGVIGMIDVLHQTELAPDQSRMLDLARDSAHSLMEIIEDILDFSKIEAGKVELECKPISVLGIVERACALVSGVAAAKGVALTVRADPVLPATVWGDAGRLRQVLVNLVANAVKFSSGRDVAGSVSIEATVSARSPDGVMVDLAVRDNGIGMDAAMIARLFTPFSQADASTTRRFGGTGLGLTISKNLVTLMGGEILVNSRPDVGSVFTVHLPFTWAPALGVESLRRADAAGDGPRARPRGQAPRRPELVLVAEDNAINQQVIVEQLRLLGFGAEVVANGCEALALWRSGRFAVLLTDLQMPVMDGYGLSSSIRREEGEGPRMPIIALTANALKEEADRCRAAGMDEYLTKPVQVGTLEATLQRWLDGGAAAAAWTAELSAPPPRRGERGEAVDATVLPSLIGNDPARLSEFLLDFVAIAGTGATGLHSALAAGRVAQAGAVAHRLKSSARAIGAIHLGDLCEAIELAAT
ncbi:MAG TPA: ATP-binding protein, partial [Caldimonas sp.]